MPPRTLLSLLSKGKYETSEDLPTMPEMAHSYIDNIIESYEESKQYEPEVKGTGLGMLEWAAAPPVGKAGKLISSQIKPGSSEWKNIIQQLKLTTVFNPKEEEKFFAYLRKQRDFKLGRLNPTESKKMAEIESMVGGPKYKDAPHRELQDIVLKLDEMIIKTPKSKAIEEARYSLDKTLLRGMEHVEKYGWSSPAHDINTKNLYRTLIKLLEGKSTPFTKTTKKQGGGYITKPDDTRVNIPDDYSIYQSVDEQYGTPGVRHRGKTFFPLHAPSYQMIIEMLLKDKLAPMIIGEALAYNKAPHKKREIREGSRVINNLLNKLSIGDAPGGLVPYKTMRSQPWKSFGERGELFGELRYAKDATIAPDTAFFYNPYHKNVRQSQISYGAPHEAFHANPELQQRLWDREEFSTHQEAFHQLIDNLRKNIDAEELDNLQRLFLKGEELSNLPPILRNRKPK